MFNSDDYDFLKGGLMRVGVQGLNTSSGVLPTAPVFKNDQTYLTSLYTAYRASNCNIISTTIATVFSFYGFNASAAAVRYLQLHDTASVVASGAIPKLVALVPAAPQEHSHNYSQLSGGQQFSLGVVYAWSSTPNSFTPVQGGDVGLELHYR